jgi:L-alanine-DL-glutamate epimerase-like enolase superfamily enzyme
MTTTSTCGDSIAWVRVSSCYLTPANPISDAKVLTGRQNPMTEIAMLFAEIETRDGHKGLGFSYAQRAGGPGQFAHAKEIAPPQHLRRPFCTHRWSSCWRPRANAASAASSSRSGSRIALWTSNGWKRFAAICATVSP